MEWLGSRIRSHFQSLGRQNRIAPLLPPEEDEEIKIIREKYKVKEQFKAFKKNEFDLIQNEESIKFLEKMVNVISHENQIGLMKDLEQGYKDNTQLKRYILEDKKKISHHNLENEYNKIKY